MDQNSKENQERNYRVTNDYDAGANTPSEKSSWTIAQCVDHKWTLEDHLAYGLAHRIQWCDLREKMMVALVCRMVGLHDPVAANALTAERAKILGEHLVHAAEQTLKAAGITLQIDQSSGCGKSISRYSINGVGVLIHFEGDRCNRPASETGWAWI